jgi:hypothetical protein
MPSSRVFSLSGCILLPLTLLPLTLLSGCDRKVSECNQLITIVNRISDDLSKIQTDVKTAGQATGQGQTADQMAAQLDQFVASLDKNTQEMVAIGVEPPLQPFQQKLVAAYKTALNNSRALTTAVKTKNQPAAQAALNALNAAGSGEAKTLKEVSDYCQAPSK